MNPELLMKMLDAGFSKDEIMKLTGMEPAKGGEELDAGNKPAAETENTPADENKPEAAAEDKPAAETENTPAAEDKPQDNTGKLIETRIESLEKNINKLVRAIQAGNLLNTSGNGSSDSLEDETDKIMRSIIRPEIKKKEGI